MANTIWGYANTALYTLHPTHHVVAELDRTGEAKPVFGVTGPWVLGLWTDYGHGIALQGTTAEILHFLRLAIEHVARETRQEGLPDVLNELATVRARREELLAGNPTTEDLEAAAGYELQELDLLRWIAEATSELIDHRP
ncbi:MAG: hypothetical protein KIH64_001685 [Mycobacterium sp.]|nr:hypothetical protein [Mycobacterium sp.]